MQERHGKYFSICTRKHLMNKIILQASINSEPSSEPKK